MTNKIPLTRNVPEVADADVVVGAGRGAYSEPALPLRVMVTTMAVGQEAGTASASVVRREGS